MTRFARWYDRNASSLSQKRRERYRSDPAYREKAKAASRSYKDRSRDHQPPEYTVEFSDAADRLAVSTKTLRAWQRKGWFPEPLMYDRRRYFTEDQLELLQSIASHLKAYKGDSTDEIRHELSIKVQLVHLNWS